MLLLNAGRRIADWLKRGFIQCANIQVSIARSITASVRKFGSCVYDDAVTSYGKQGLYRSLKCLKVLEIRHWFFKALKSLKNSTFLVKVLEFLLYNKSYDLK